jgi:glycerol-3-phosphate acyltransferase PlsX
LRIGIDLMGSESSPKDLLEAVFESVDLLESSDSFIVYATKEIIETRSIFPQEANKKSRVDILLVPEYITMEDDPLTAVRLKKSSSLVIGITQLKEKKIDALVTAGNTGALITCAAILLPLLKDIERPALLASLPTLKKPLALIDVGGMISIKPHHLVQNAHLGAAFQRCILGIDTATVGLLNVGIESKKGTPEAREAYRLLAESSKCSNSKIYFVGNVEGRDVFQGNIDVLVTDGFTGNVLLKTSEGISNFIFDYLFQELKEEERLVRALTVLQRRFNYDEYPGALVCGIDGILVKCHGAVTKKGVKQSIKGAIQLVRNHLLKKILEELSA